MWIEGSVAVRSTKVLIGSRLQEALPPGCCVDVDEHHNYLDDFISRRLKPLPTVQPKSLFQTSIGKSVYVYSLQRD